MPPRTCMPNHTTNSRPTVATSGIICAVAVLLMPILGCERMQDTTASENAVVLQDGMGLLEAAGALGCEGQRAATGMRARSNPDPGSWNVEWRIGCVYDVEDTQVLAVYSAWAPGEATEDAPPRSAYRLVEWSTSSSTTTDSHITLWSGSH